jgi:DGQHR domain-containing protein
MALFRSAVNPRRTIAMSRFTANIGVTIPALRGKQGARTMYLALPSNAVVNNFIPPDMEPSHERSQRAFDPSHARRIGEYMVSNPDDYVLGAITYAIDREGTFDPVEPGAPIGMLTIPLEARMRSIDGQHRRHGIKTALEVMDTLGEEHSAILFYVESDVEKRKQMFSDMNWTPRPVSKSVNVGFDHRDPFSRAVQHLVDSHPLLMGRAEAERASIPKGSTNLYTLGILHDVLKRLVIGPERRLTAGKKVDDTEIIEAGDEFFTFLMESRDEFQRVHADPEITEEVRKDTILLNGTALRMIAGAVFFATQDRGYTLDDLKEPMGEIDFSPTAALWQTETGFVPVGKTTPNSRLQEIRAATSALLDRIAPVHVESAEIDDPESQSDADVGAEDDVSAHKMMALHSTSD